MGAHFRFVHCADLHLGSRFRGIELSDPVEAERMRRSIFESFSRIVDRAVSDADAMIISGDSFDETTITPMTRMFLVDELRRFGKPVFMVKGNHDPLTNWDDAIPYPDNVHLFGTDPENIPIPGIDGAEVVGVSFNGWKEERNLPSMMHGTPGLFSIGCVHCDVDSIDSEYSYSPCRSTDLLGRGIDYWALGHIHKRSLMRRDPYVVYPGNIQGRHFKESGEKGAYLVTVRDGHVSDVEFFATQSIVWMDITMDITDMETLEDIVSFLESQSVRGNLLRITFKGSGSLDKLIREGGRDLTRILSKRNSCSIASIEVDTAPIMDLDSFVGRKDLVGMILSECGALEGLDRDGKLSIVLQNPVLKAFADDIGDISDESLASIILDAKTDLASRMGVRE